MTIKNRVSGEFAQMVTCQLDAEQTVYSDANHYRWKTANVTIENSTISGQNSTTGRVGSAIGPLTGGYLFAMHVPLQETLFIAAGPLIIGLIVSILIVPLYSKQLVAA